MHSMSYYSVVCNGAQLCIASLVVPAAMISCYCICSKTNCPTNYIPQIGLLLMWVCIDVTLDSRIPLRTSQLVCDIVLMGPLEYYVEKGVKEETWNKSEWVSGKEGERALECQQTVALNHASDFWAQCLTCTRRLVYQLHNPAKLQSLKNGRGLGVLWSFSLQNTYKMTQCLLHCWTQEVVHIKYNLHIPKSLCAPVFTIAVKEPVCIFKSHGYTQL